jgi:hypothetical protein
MNQTICGTPYKFHAKVEEEVIFILIFLKTTTIMMKWLETDSENVMCLFGQLYSLMQIYHGE